MFLGANVYITVPVEISSGVVTFENWCENRGGKKTEMLTETILDNRGRPESETSMSSC